MISIIVSSYKQEYYEALKKNVHATIGVVYEIIKIDNPGLMGICQAYNKGAERAKFEILCFIHEDIIFHTKNWGSIIVDTLKNNTIGLLGLAGGTYKPRIISSAWHNGDLYINMLQHKEGKCFHWLEPKNFDKKIADVLVVDGVFLSTRKKLWHQCRFDEKTLKGFHFYDLDISLAIKSLGLRVCVVYEVLVEHFSFGSNSREWYEEAKKIHHKWEKKLPWSSEQYDNSARKKFDINAATQELNIVLKNRYITFFNKTKVAFLFVLTRPFKIETYKILKSMIFYQQP
jgi:glycosyltransferase involved in cell wall biosynthesis